MNRVKHNNILKRFEGVESYNLSDYVPYLYAATKSYTSSADMHNHNGIVRYNPMPGWYDKKRGAHFFYNILYPYLADIADVCTRSKRFLVLAVPANNWQEFMNRYDHAMLDLLTIHTLMKGSEGEGLITKEIVYIPPFNRGKKRAPKQPEIQGGICDIQTSTGQAISA